MSNKAKISVVIPAHNEQEFIGKTLLSFTRQTHQPHELIVVCDSCTDDTQEIADQLGAKTIEVSHRSISATRNSGYQISTGDIIIFQDADSVPAKNYLENIAWAYEQGVQYGAAKLVPETDNSLNVYRLYAMNLLSRVRGVFYGSSLFVTRKLLDRVGIYDPQIPWAEDIDITNRLRKFGKAKWKLLKNTSVRYSERKFIKNGYVKEMFERAWKMKDYYAYKLKQQNSKIAQ